MSKRITSLTPLTTPKDDMELIVTDVDDTFDKKITYANLMKPLTGSAAPAVTPDFIGQRFIDTTGNREYYAVGTASSADWRKVARHEYGIATITAGAGDVTVNLDFDWSDGDGMIMFSDTAGAYFEDSANVDFFFLFTYDGLTNASYTTRQTLRGRNQSAASSDTLRSNSKGANETGQPKSATVNSLTLDDDTANTKYIKWVINA